MQHLFPAAVFLVVDVYYRALPVRRHAVIVHELCRHEGVSSQPPLKLRVLSLKLVVVLKARVEEISAVLNVAHTRLPEHVQQVDALYRDISQPAELVRVPVYFVYARPGLELLPHAVRVGFLKLVLLQYHRYDL